MRSIVPTFAAFATLSLLAATAHAQSSPSADAIMKALTPTGSSMLGTTRGLKPVKPPAAPMTAQTPAPVQTVASATPVVHAAPPVAAQAQAQTQAESGAPSINLTVQFPTGSAQLTPAAMHTLDELGRALSSATLASYRFRIEGHTDTVGSRDVNMSLSQARASAVVAYLSGKYSVAANRLEAVGRGSEAPLVPTPDQTAEPRNRRVQVVNLGA